MKLSTGSAVPPMNMAGASMVAAGGAGRDSPLRGGGGVGHLFPVGVEVAIPVEPAGEPGTGELGHVVIDLVGGDPVRQVVGLRKPLDEAGRPRCDHPQSGR